MTREEKRTRLAEVETELAGINTRLLDLIAAQYNAKTALDQAKVDVRLQESNRVDLLAEQLKLLRGLR